MFNCKLKKILIQQYFIQFNKIQIIRWNSWKKKIIIIKNKKSKHDKSKSQINIHRWTECVCEREREKQNVKTMFLFVSILILQFCYCFAYSQCCLREWLLSALLRRVRRVPTISFKSVKWSQESYLFEMLLGLLIN